MTAMAAMKPIGEHDGLKYYWAEPGEFTRAGVHFWNGRENVHVEPVAVEAAQRLRALIDSPEIEDFLRAVHIEAVHQVEKWGTASDLAKRPADWFWLVGYLSGKALHAAVSDNREKALHHCISTAAALYNWHCAIKGIDVHMCPGRSDLAEGVEAMFPNQTGKA